MCERCEWGFSETRIELEFQEGRRQIVELDFFDFEGRQLVRVFSKIGDVSRIHPMRLTDALRLNYSLPHGAMAVKRDVLVMVNTLHVDDASDAEIEATVRYLAEMADHYEKTMFGTDDH